jgi:hypothetical protein
MLILRKSASPLVIVEKSWQLLPIRERSRSAEKLPSAANSPICCPSLVGSTALSARTRPEDLSEASPVSSPFRPAEMIGGGFLRSPQAPTFSPTAADDRRDGDIQAAETGEAYAHYDDLPSPRWRGRLGTAVVVLCLAGLGAVGAFAYRAVLAGTEWPTLPPIVKAENGANSNVSNSGDAQPSRSSQTSIASAGASEEFLSRWPADNQEPPKTVPIPPNPGTPPPSALGSAAVAPIATASAASPPGLPPVPLAASAPPPPSSDPKRSHAVISRSNGSGHPDTSAAAAKSSGTKQSAAAPPVGNQPLSLAPDGHGHSAASSRSREPAATGIAAEASSGGGYAIAVASERSAADDVRCKNWYA